MRGLYIVRLNLDEPHAMGVAKKIRAQVKVLSGALGDVDLFYTEAACVMRNGAVAAQFGAGRLGKWLLHAALFYGTLARIRTAFDFVYIRYQRTSPAFLWMLARLRASHPRATIVVELPTFPYHSEYKTARQWMVGRSDRVLRRFIGRYVDRIVTFSQFQQILGIPTICTDNATEVAAMALLPKPPLSQDIRLLGLANLSFWHGYDRVIAGLAAYRDQNGSRRVTFDIVGAGPESDRLKQDARRLDLTDVVRFHGPLQGSALDDVVAQCHIAISSIGMHRLDTDTSNLKSREFCARGLPFVIAYPDRDFGAEFPFAFHAPMTDAPLDIGAVLSFYDDLRQTVSDYPQQMRKYAEARLTWEAKLAPVVTYIRQAQAQRA